MKYRCNHCITNSNASELNVAFNDMRLRQDGVAAFLQEDYFSPLEAVIMKLDLEDISNNHTNVVPLQYVRKFVNQCNFTSDETSSNSLGTCIVLIPNALRQPAHILHKWCSRKKHCQIRIFSSGMERSTINV
jgi:hypothetical protein